MSARLSGWGAGRRRSCVATGDFAHDVDLRGHQGDLPAQVKPGEQAEYEGKEAVEWTSVWRSDVVDVVAAEVLEDLPQGRATITPGSSARQHLGGGEQPEGRKNSIRLTMNATTTRGWRRATP